MTVAALALAALVTTAPSSCEPPGAPPGWRYWPVVAAEAGLLAGADGRTVQIAMITHDAGQGRRVIAGWARGRLVLFDGLPGVLLALYDAGALTEREIRAEPWGVCAWRRFTGME